MKKLLLLLSLITFFTLKAPIDNRCEILLQTLYAIRDSCTSRHVYNDLTRKICKIGEQLKAQKLLQKEIHSLIAHRELTTNQRDFDFCTETIQNLQITLHAWQYTT